MLELSRRVFARLHHTARESGLAYYGVASQREESAGVERTALVPAYRRERC